MADALEYPLAGRGVFVMIKQDRHHFQQPWHNLAQLDYETDKRDILQTFNLAENSLNVLLAENLTNEPGKDGFDTFMDTFKDSLVLKDERNEEPSFVMFILTSHGIENGGVLLATPEGLKEKVKPCYCSNRLHHSGGSHCYVRYITKHIMAKVCSAYPDIPKVFLIQTCRGEERNVTAVGSADVGLERADDEHPSETELFILQSPDCFLFRPCVEGNGCWAGVPGSKIGSFLISRFCETLRQLRQSANKSAEELKKLSMVKGGAEHLHPFTGLVSLLCLETLEGGWLANVCQRTTSLACNKLVMERYADGEVPVDKQNPHYSSSLAYKLSCLKMLKTEWGEQDSYLAEWFEDIQKEEVREEDG